MSRSMEQGVRSARTKKLTRMGIFAFTAAVLLLFFSRCSPLYPTNSWQDANCFFTVGRGMLKGMLPYRDFVEQKGPLLYALHALAACISPQSFIGVYLIEIVALTAFLYIAYNMVRLFLDGRVLPQLLFMLLLLVSCRAFVFGDTVEEMMLPLQTWTLYDLMRYVRTDGRKISYRRLILNGFLAGCIFWMKYSLLGIHLASMAVIAIDTVIREKKLWHALCMCLAFLLGMLVLSSIPWLIYFGVNGALSDLFSVYFLNNLSGYGQGNPIVNVILGVGGGMVYDPAIAVLMLVGVGSMLVKLFSRKWTMTYTAISAAIFCQVIMTYFYGRLFRYTFMALMVFLPLCIVPTTRMFKRFLAGGKRTHVALTLCFALLLSGYNIGRNNSLPYIGFPKEDLAQTKIGNYVKEHGGGSIINYNFGDGGFYLATDSYPTTPYFMKLMLNSADVAKHQQEAIAEQKIRWIVVRDQDSSKREIYEAAGYDMVLEAESPFDRDTKPEATIRHYALYKLREDEVSQDT